jgi:hypothetical protein
MLFSFSILRPATMEDQVHIGMSPLQKIVAATPTIKVTTTCELCDDVNYVIDVV